MNPRSMLETDLVHAQGKNSRDLMVVFVEVDLADASEFAPQPVIAVAQEQGRYVIKITQAASISPRVNFFVSPAKLQR